MNNWRLPNGGGGSSLLASLRSMRRRDDKISSMLPVLEDDAVLLLASAICWLTRSRDACCETDARGGCGGFLLRGGYQWIRLKISRSLERCSYLAAIRVLHWPAALDELAHARSAMRRSS
jgi:hypothetical protein